MGSDVTYLDAVRDNAATLAAAARKAGLDAAVPSCPDWTVADLVRHAGRVFTSCAAVVRERGPVDFKALPQMPKDETVVDEFERRAAALVDALAALPEDYPIWNWFGIEPPIPGFYHRRMANEIAVHRYDGELAAGTTSPIDTALAVDGVDEFLTLFLGNAQGDVGGSIHIHATDADCEWIVREENGKLVATPGHEKADVAVRGSASDLLLFLENRVPVTALDVVGNADIARAWKDTVTF